MLSIIRPTSYNGNLQSLKPDFYNFRETQDELAAELIAKSIRKLLKKVHPNISRRRTESQNCTNQNENEASTFPKELDNRLFHSDSSLASSHSKKSKFTSSFSSNYSLVEKTTNRSKEYKNVEVLLPDDMLTRLARDIVRMAEGEHNGIKGCQLSVLLKDGDKCHNAGKINCDPKITPFCLLRVQLTSMDSPPQQSYGSQILRNRLLGGSCKEIYIKPGYMIEKKRLSTH